MNIILFNEDETNLPLAKKDPRTIHLIKTLHKKAGDEFAAGVIDGKYGKGFIETINADGSINITLWLTKEAPRRLPLRVAVGFTRPIQLRRLLRDLSSMGVSYIDLLQTELTDKSYKMTNLLNDGGAQKALLEGAIQSRDTTLPVLSLSASIFDWLKDLRKDKKENEILIACDNINTNMTFSDLQPCQKSVIIVIGPERGFSDKERAELEDAGFMRVSMGSRALRTETACVAAVALALERCGFFR